MRFVLGSAAEQALLALSLHAIVGQLILLWACRRSFRHIADIDDEPLPDALPPLLVVVPARDEESNLPLCLAALEASRYPAPLRIRVVDDASSDRTAEIARARAARDPRVEVRDAGPLPPGWLGKNHALHVGTHDADTEWLLLLDADVRVGPDCLARAVAAALRREADLLTGVPRVETVSFWELAAHLLVIQVVFALMPTRKINDPAASAAGASGPFMLFRRSAYERIGGHAAMRAEVVEDKRLAEAIKGAGLRLVLARGVAVSSVRMYRSLSGIVQGWSKNVHVTFGKFWWATPFMSATLLVPFAGPWLLLPLSLAARAWPASLVATVAIALAVAARLDLARTYRLSARHPWLQPLGAAVLAYILVRSAVRVALGRATLWKGRRV